MVEIFKISLFALVTIYFLFSFGKNKTVIDFIGFLSAGMALFLVFFDSF